MALSSTAVEAGEVLKRVVIAGLNPFNSFAKISKRPDSVGPFLCLFLLAFASFAGNALLLSKTFILSARGTPIPPRVEWEDSALKVVFVNATSFRRLGFPAEEHYSVLNAVALGYSFLTWIAAAVGLRLALKVSGGYTGLTIVLSGYSLSARIYENLARAVTIALYLSGVPRINMYVPADLKVGALLYLATIAAGKVEGFTLALRAQEAFFAVWNIVVYVAAASQGGALPMKKSALGGILGYFISSVIILAVYPLMIAYL